MSKTPTAGASSEPDPIFGAIERHRAARRGWLATHDRLGVLQDMIPKRRWQIFGERPDDRTDPPEWIEANTAFLAAEQELDKALEAVLSTPPTTITGVADLLDYVGRHECEPLPCENPGTLLAQKGAANFLLMIAATLPRRATGEPDPIFAAMERHRAALRGWLAAYDRFGVAQEMIPVARRRWQIFDERPDDCTNPPEWIEAITAFRAAHEELDKALEFVLSTPPTTITGVADLLDYVSRYAWELAGAREYSEVMGDLSPLANEYDETVFEGALCEDPLSDWKSEYRRSSKSSGQLPAHDRRNLALTHSGTGPESCAVAREASAKR